MSDVKDLAKTLLAELAPALGEIVKAEVQKHLPPPVAAVVGGVVDALEANAETSFARNEPGIGGPLPRAPLPLEGAEVSEIIARINSIDAKLDALVQVTGHGNSAALAAHL